jgi:steroid 5-alpha reductase family enzyme
LQVFFLQAVLAWIISIPLLAASRGDTDVGVIDWLGAMVWVIGFFFEAVGDFQMARFKADPENKGKVLNRGVWRFTRHPNYFGDAAQWWGFYLIALAAGGFWTIYAAGIMTWLLLRVSGVTMLEKTLTQTKPQYEEYIRRTSAFVPMPPKKETLN